MDKEIKKEFEKLNKRFDGTDKRLDGMDKRFDGVAMKEDLKGFATKEDLKGFATKEDLKGFATKEDLKGFATKEDLKQAVAPLATKLELTAQTKELKVFAREQTEELARIIANTVAAPMQNHFEELKDELEVREEVQTLKRDMLKIKQALHIS